MNELKIKSPLNPKLEVSVYQGHFATRHCHNSHYIDITRMKHEHTMAREAAITIAQRYAYTKAIDSIVCMDGSEVIGAFLAYHMCRRDRFNVNENKSIDVITPEFDHTGQMIFRDNLIPMVTGKNVLLLISTVKSGKTISRMLECMEYYGASVQGIATVFSTAESLDGIPVYSLFTPDDLPGYISRDAKECPMCKEGQKITAIANSYGLSKL
jgi:orotate phosphoribosyltransferase